MLHQCLFMYYAVFDVKVDLCICCRIHRFGMLLITDSVSGEGTAVSRVCLAVHLLPLFLFNLSLCVSMGRHPS